MAKNPKIDIKEEEEESALSPIAPIFHEPCFNVYVMAIAGCKTRIKVDVKANLEHTRFKHPRFSSLQVKDVKKDGGMKWVPTKVDLDKHIIIPKLHDIIDSPNKMVEDYPPWELHILNIKTSDSLSNGMSLMFLVLTCTRQISNPKALPTFSVKKTSNPDPINSSRIWWIFQLDTKTSLSSGQKKGDGLGPRRFVYRTISIDDIKLIKNGMKTVMRPRKIKGATEKRNNLPKNIHLRETLLIDMARDKETMLSLLIIHSANCVENMVTPFTSAITDLILIFKAIHLQIFHPNFYLVKD
ncbi:hypothetical protein PVL29_020192 [Vitis rotundifolia]|uniref:Uncharacterized protein n=1 Tax=Vitis rotundifolia TaxID=103349 RepID=A0AA38Z3B3_VITRO|nr:hypothetical protein PVL29_020192 [Vitis rotundifolia]